jgi:hypothetical protein
MSGAEIAQAELAKNARREIFVLSFFIVILLIIMGWNWWVELTAEGVDGARF